MSGWLGYHRFTAPHGPNTGSFCLSMRFVSVKRHHSTLILIVYFIFQKKTLLTSAQHRRKQHWRKRFFCSHAFYAFHIAALAQHARQFLHPVALWKKQLYAVIWDINEGRQPSIEHVTGMLQVYASSLGHNTPDTFFYYFKRGLKENRNFCYWRSTETKINTSKGARHVLSNFV